MLRLQRRRDSTRAACCRASDHRATTTMIGAVDQRQRVLAANRQPVTVSAEARIIVVTQCRISQILHPIMIKAADQWHMPQPILAIPCTSRADATIAVLSGSHVKSSASDHS